MSLARPISANNNIQPLHKLKVGIGENGEILKVEAL